MRKELNEERTSHINARRAVDELQVRILTTVAKLAVSWNVVKCLVRALCEL